MKSADARALTIDEVTALLHVIETRGMGRFLTAALVFLCACDGCDEEEGPRVPFGVDTGEATPPSTGGAADEPDEPPFEARAGQSFPAGARRVAIEGAPIELDEGEVRSVLAVDLDEDGDRDALVVSSTDGALALWHSRRDGSTFAPARSLASTAPLAEGCSVSEVSTSTVSAEYAVATITRACPEGLARTVWIVSLEAQPRLRESITVLPETGRARGDVRIALRTADADEDGHTDVLLDVSVVPGAGGDAAAASGGGSAAGAAGAAGAAASPGAGAATVSIAWLDRPGGLARDTAEPEASLGTLAQRARESLARDPAGALVHARGALALHAALCREGGAPRIALGGAEGIACGASQGAGRAAAVATAALAKRGEVFEALAARERLDDPAFRVPAADRRAADAALAELAVTDGVRAIEGPAAMVGAAPDVHLPLVGFRDDHTLVVRGVAPAVYRVTDDGVAPIEPAETVEGDVVLTDPSGRWAVVDVQRTCEGYVLAIVRASEVVSGVVAGRAVSRPLLEPRAPPPGAQCPGELPGAARDDDGGWRIAGWAPQGVVAIRRDEVRLVPLTVSAASAGDPIVLDARTPAPAPLPAGRMSPDAAAYALATPIGIVVRRGDRTTVVRPDAYTPEVDSVAVSPNGRRIAFVAAGKAHVATIP